jgi:hypothetical protein
MYAEMLFNELAQRGFLNGECDGVSYAQLTDEAKHDLDQIVHYIRATMIEHTVNVCDE